MTGLIENCCRLQAGALAIVFALCAWRSNASPGYLINGPTSLRFAADVSKTNVFQWPPLFPIKNSESDIAVHPSAPVATPMVTLAPAPVAPAPTNNGVFPTLPESAKPPALGPTAQVGNSSANDSLAVTPQMVADLLQQGAALTNRLGPSTLPGPELPFYPPTPRPPDSQATYHIQ